MRLRILFVSTALVVLVGATLAQAASSAPALSMCGGVTIKKGVSATGVSAVGTTCKVAKNTITKVHPRRAKCTLAKPCNANAFVCWVKKSRKGKTPYWTGQCTKGETQIITYGLPK